jgi:hypothetical protein
MIKWQPLWLALSFAVVYAANRGLAPTIAYEMTSAMRTMPTGTLVLEVSGRRHEVKLASVVIVNDVLRPLLADERPVGVLWLRAIEEGQGADPDVELFVDLLGSPAAPGPGPDPTALRDRTLTVLHAAPGSMAPSHIRLPGDSAPRRVRAGTLHVARVLTLDAGADGKRVRLEGTLHLSLEGDGGAEAIRGTYDARVVP